MFEIYLALYFVVCTGFFIFAMRRLMKNYKQISLSDVIESLYFSYVPGVNFTVLAVVLRDSLSSLTKKADNITLWKKKDE